MNFRNPYAYSLYSTICVIVFCRLFFYFIENITDVETLVLSCLKCMMLGILGGITLLLCGLLDRTYLKHSFIYNLVATFNLLIGAISTFFLLYTMDRIPILIALNLIVGVLMYRNIFKA